MWRGTAIDDHHITSFPPGLPQTGAMKWRTDGRKNMEQARSSKRTVVTAGGTAQRPA